MQLLEELAKDVQTELAPHKNITVSTDDNCIVLRGRTSTFYNKQCIQEAAMKKMRSSSFELRIFVEVG